MDWLFEGVFPCIYSFATCIGYCVVCNSPRRTILPASFCGGAGWGVYLAFAFTGNDLYQYFAAAVAITMLSEILARVQKCPVTLYLIPALLPLVPGGGIYYTMEHCLNGDNDLFLQTGLHTLAIAGCLALGVLLVTSLVRLWKSVKPALFHPRRPEP